MFKFFETILQTLERCVDYVKNAIDTVIQMFDLAVKAIEYYYNYYQVLPSFLLPFALILLTICVFKFIMNLGGN